MQKREGGKDKNSKSPPPVLVLLFPIKRKEGKKEETIGRKGKGKGKGEE